MATVFSGKVGTRPPWRMVLMFQMAAFTPVRKRKTGMGMGMKRGNSAQGGVRCRSLPTIPAAPSLSCKTLTKKTITANALLLLLLPNHMLLPHNPLSTPSSPRSPPMPTTTPLCNP